MASRVAGDGLGKLAVSFVRSQLGYEFSIAGACFEACSRRQHSVAVNTAVAELFAASTAAAILITINGVLRFITFGILGVPPVVFCQSSSPVVLRSLSTEAV